MANRTVDRGEPIDEAVTKGSITYYLRDLSNAFYRAFPDSEKEYFYISEVFSDHLIVYSDKLRRDEFYFVTYRQENGQFVFAPRDQWEVVELTYQPRTLQERLRQQEGQRLSETVPSGAWLGEAAASGPRTIHVDWAVAGAVNGNGRRYPLAVLREAVLEARTHLHESMSQGRAVVLGEAEHPAQKERNGVPSKFTETIVTWQDLWMENGVAKAKGYVIENTEGKDAIVTMEAGVLPGVSLRGFGEGKIVKDPDGRKVEEMQWLRLTGIDLVKSPSFHDAAVTKLESQMEENTMSDMQDTQTPVEEEQELTADVIYATRPDLVEALLEKAKLEKELKEAKARKEAEAEQNRLRALIAEQDKQLRENLGIDETADLKTAVSEQARRLRELEEADTKRKVQAYTAEEVGKLKYPPETQKSMLEAVGEPATIEEAKAAIAHHRKLLDRVVADMRLRMKGYHGVDMLGPVWENETGTPEFARASFEITEALRRRQMMPSRGNGRKPTIQEELAAQYLEAFDKAYKAKLIKEAAEYAEAEQTSDLNLPYSVMRAVIEAAYPLMVSPVIFDYGLDTQSPSRVYYESYAEDDTVTATITDEAVTGDHGNEVALAHKRLVPGTVVLTSSPAGTTYVEGTDYVIDYAEGKLITLAAGSTTDAQSLLIDYQYQSIREGEMSVIKRAKGTLAFVTMNHFADRLATQISREVIVFSRSQLGQDAVVRTINLLSKELAKTIDLGRFRLALASAMQVASNSGGTWTVASDTYLALVEKIGAAKVLVENRNYEATFALMSKTNSDRLGNWDGFTAAGQRPDGDLNANGYVGRVKGLPVFETSNFTDSQILVGNREIVMARVFQPMQLMGPYPSIDASTGNLIAADQYFIEEFNGQVSPVKNKAATVTVA